MTSAAILWFALGCLAWIGVLALNAHFMRVWRKQRAESEAWWNAARAELRTLADKINRQEDA